MAEYSSHIIWELKIKGIAEFTWTGFLTKVRGYLTGNRPGFPHSFSRQMKQVEENIRTDVYYQHCHDLLYLKVAWYCSWWNMAFTRLWSENGCSQSLTVQCEICLSGSFDSSFLCVLQDLKGISCRGRGTQMSVVLPCVILWSKPGLELRVHRMSFLRAQMENSPALPLFLYCLALKRERYSTVTSTKYRIISAPYLRNSNDEWQGNQHSVVQWHFCRERKSHFFF